MTHTFLRLRNVFAILVSLFLVTAVLAQNAPEKSAETPSQDTPVVVIPIRYDPPRIIAPLIRLRINGGEPESFILDTGSGFPLVVTEEYARRAGLPRVGKEATVNGTLKLPYAELKSAAIITSKNDKTNDVPINGLDRALVTDYSLRSAAPGEKSRALLA